MRNGIKYLGVILLISMTFSCVNKHGSEKKPELKQESLNSDDKIRIIQLTTDYLDHLKKKEFEEALQMLHIIRNDSVFSLTDTAMERMREQYANFPVLSYQIKNYHIRGIRDTEVAYTIEFFRSTEEDMIPNTINFRLNPQKINNVWYLSLVTR